MCIFVLMRFYDIVICFCYSEFLDGDKRMKKIIRGYVKENLRRESYIKYFWLFRKVKIDVKIFWFDIEFN